MVAFVRARGAGEPGDAAEGHGATATAHRSVVALSESRETLASVSDVGAAAARRA